MEIIHLILGKANPDRMNGVNKVVYQLTTQQAIAGRKVSIWGISKNTEHNYGERNFETRLFQAYRNPFKIDKKLKEDLKSIKGKAIIHIHGGWIPVYSSLATFLHKHSIPFVLTPHGAYNTIAMNRSGQMKKFYFQFFEKKMLQKVSKIHSLGESEIEGLNGVFPNTKSILIPYGFESIDFELNKDNKSADFIIGFVGRLDIYTKGLDLLVEAFGQFKSKVKNTKLWIIGDSEEKSKLELIIKEKHIENEVVLFGSKFADEKNELIQQMSIFVHCSRNEGLPTAVLEAASFGVPCVVTNATNVTSYVNKFNSGISIKDENVSELTDAFEKFYDVWQKNEITEIQLNAQKMVKEAFNWKKVVENFDILYKI
jgi:glycosyltransferase involved in cell wall biosynthesis